MSIFRSTPPPGRWTGPVFSLDGPEGWTDETVYIYGGPIADGLRHTITVARDPEPETSDLSDYTHNRQCEAAATLPNSLQLIEDTIVLRDGRLGGRFIVQYADPGDSARSVREYLCVCVLTEAGGFVLSTTFTRASRHEIGADVEAVMRSFSLVHHRS